MEGGRLPYAFKMITYVFFQILYCHTPTGRTKVYSDYFDIWGFLYSRSAIFFGALQPLLFPEFNPRIVLLRRGIFLISLCVTVF